jgi:voltage-gated potassium channel
MRLTARKLEVKDPFPQWRFLQLLLVFIFLMLVFPSIERTWLAHLVLQALLIDLLLVTIWATPQWGRVHRLLVGFLLLAIGASIMVNLNLQKEWIPLGETAQGLLRLPILTACVVGILTFVFEAEQPTLDGIFATVVAYLLVGMIFSELYAIALVWDPDALHLTMPLQQMTQQARGGEILYFSIATISTVGYGDTLPTSEFTRMLAAVEAVFGQFYVAVIVAVLVGRYAAEAQEQIRSRRAQANPVDDQPDPDAAN